MSTGIVRVNKVDCYSYKNSTTIAINFYTLLSGNKYRLIILAGGDSQNLDYTLSQLLVEDPNLATRRDILHISKLLEKQKTDYTVLVKNNYSMFRKKNNNWKVAKIATTNNTITGLVIADILDKQNINKLVSYLIKNNNKVEDLEYSTYLRYITSSIEKEASTLYSERGLRRTNQDSLGIVSMKYCRGREENRVKIGIVADGAGGLARGEKASTSTVLLTLAFTLSTILNRVEVTGNTIKRIIERVSSYINKLSSAHHQYMASTLALYLQYNNRVLIANVGDTVILKVADNDVEPLSTLHQTRLSNGRTALTSYIGQVKPDIHVRELDRDEVAGAHIVIATDGVYNYIDKKTILEKLSTQKRIGAISKKLVEEAKIRGSRDNMSVLVMRLYYGE